MKNKLLAGLGIAILTFGVGSAVYADVNELNFQEMLPFMKQMHPGATEQQLNEMYESCHGSDGGPMHNGQQTRGGVKQDGSMMRGNNGGGWMMWNGQTDSLQDI